MENRQGIRRIEGRRRREWKVEMSERNRIEERRMVGGGQKTGR